MCHCPHHLDVSFTQDPPHSHSLFLTLLPLVSPAPFLRILVAYLCISCSSPFLTDPPFPFLSFIPFSHRFFPYRESFGLFFGPYPGTRKQSTLHSIEGGMGGKPTGFMFCLPWGFFSPIPHIFNLLYISHFILSNFK